MTGSDTWSAKLEKLLNARERLKEQKREIGRKILEAQILIGAASDSREKRNLQQAWQSLQPENDRLRELLYKNLLLIRKEESEIRESKHFDFAHVFLHVVKELASPEDFQNWCDVAEQRYNEHLTAVKDELFA